MASLITMTDAYIRHVVREEPMRRIAADIGKPASTIMRWIRRIEDMREDDRELSEAIDKDNVRKLVEKRGEEAEQESQVRRIVQKTFAHYVLQGVKGNTLKNAGYNQYHLDTLMDCQRDIAFAELDDPRIDRYLKLLGVTLGEVLIRVCRTHDGIEEIERKVGIPARSGKAILRAALEVVHNHWKYNT